VQTKSLRQIIFSVLFLLLFAPGAQALDAGGLMGMLTSQLGVSEQQASGGAGALLGSAKGNMSGGEYDRLLKGAPDLAGLPTESAAAAQPAKSSSWGGMVKSASSLMGGQSQTMTQAAALAEKFDQLGLTPDMVAKYGKVMVDYVSGSGGADLAQLLTKALPL